jgi:hypothetical protein
MSNRKKIALIAIVMAILAVVVNRDDYPDEWIPAKDR